MSDFFRLCSTLGLTIIIEYPIVQIIWLFIRDKENKSKLVFFDNKLIIIPALIVNVLTNPAINVFASYLWRETHLRDNEVWGIITIAEFVVWAIEAVLYKYLLKTSWPKAFALAITANLVSYLSSFLL